MDDFYYFYDKTLFKILMVLKKSKFRSSGYKFNKKLAEFMTDQPNKFLHIRPWQTWQKRPKRTLSPDLTRLQLSLNSMVLSDQINTKIRTNMKYGTLKERNFTACVYPGLILERNVKFCSFPTYLGKIGTMNKVKRFAKECRELFANSQNGI